MASQPLFPLTASGRGLPANVSGEPLSTAVRRGVLALVVFFHVGGGWALTQFEPAKLIVGDIASLEVRTVPAEQPVQPEAQKADLPPEPPEPEPAPPEPLPPPVDLATVVDPPPPDLPPPEFPVAAAPPSPPEPPKPEPPKPVPPKPKPAPAKPAQKQPVAPAAPVEAGPPPAATAAPRTVSASQLGFLVPPNPVYPGTSRRAGQQGTVMVRVLVDIAGRPAQVSVQGSSGHAALDESAVSAVRAAKFRPYADGGLAQPVWVLVPIRFVLQ